MPQGKPERSLSRSDSATPYSDPSNICPPWSASGWHAAFLEPALPSLTWPSAPAALNHWLFREHTGFSLTSSLCHCGWPSHLQWLLPFCSRTLLDNSRSSPITTFPKKPLLTLSSPLLAPLPAAAAHPHRATFFLCSHSLHSHLFLVWLPPQAPSGQGRYLSLVSRSPIRGTQRGAVRRPTPSSQV